MHSYCIQEEKWEGITFDLRLIHATCLSFAEKDIKAVIRWEQKPCSQSSPKTTAPGSTTSDGPGTPSPECQGSMAGALLDRSPLFLQFAAVWGGLVCSPDVSVWSGTRWAVWGRSGTATSDSFDHNLNVYWPRQLKSEPQPKANVPAELYFNLLKLLGSRPSEEEGEMWPMLQQHQDGVMGRCHRKG